jgi:hypothetical protein
VGDDSHVDFCQKFQGEKVSEMYFHDATASSFMAKVWGEVFAYFCAVTVKFHSSM